MLDAKQLEALAAVLEHSSFSRAAQALNLTLAAVSLRVKALEGALGQRLMVRGKTVRPTAAGSALLGHVKHLRLLEADVLAGLGGGPGARAGSGEAAPAWQSLSVAVNADSLTNWFLPGTAPLLAEHRLLLDIVIDDQDHTHDALGSGAVAGCVTTLAQPMRGCVAEPLGVMRYRCVAAPGLLARWSAGTPAKRRKPVPAHQLLASPAVIFNRKDALQDAFLAQHYAITGASYPRHFVPAVDAFERALELGMGWGMVPDRAEGPNSTLLEEVLPGCTVDVALYWQHWAKEPQAAQRLTAAVKSAAAQRLTQMPPDLKPKVPAAQ
jgi:LysR family transcriptional regulator, chromosome initiation inhibitor